MAKMLGTMLALLLAAPAAAADLRELCADRPGLGTPACTIDPGHLQLELGIADWTRDGQPDMLTSTTLIGDLLARYGVGPSTELRLEWAGYGRQRERGRTTGSVYTAHRAGDVTLGIKQNLVSPDGKDFSAALLPSVTLPVGRQPVGDGTWSAGVLVPLSYELSDSIQLQLTPKADAKADEDGRGRHLTWGSAAGIDFALSKTLDLELELQGLRDRDPSGHETTALAAASLAYKIGEDIQLDAGGVAGLNAHSPDIEAYIGVVRRF